MQKRRERIETWRSKRKKDVEDTPQLVVVPPSKKWSLEDESDEDEPPPNPDEMGNDDEVDPLDAYMMVSSYSFYPSITSYNIYC